MLAFQHVCAEDVHVLIVRQVTPLLVTVSCFVLDLLQTLVQLVFADELEV